MSRTIDNRIVEMKFENEQFEKGIRQSRESIKELDSDLQFEGAKKGLTNLSGSINNIDLSNIEQGISSLQDRFSTFGIVGMRVIEKLTDSFIGLATRGITSVYNKIVTGGKNRAMNIENARFSLQGLIKDEQKVQDVMDVAMESVDGTAYGFDEAAKAASMFVTTGMTAKDLKGPLKALAGVAAQTNSDYSRMAEIFTTVAGNGRLMGDQLRQFSTYGLNASQTIADYFNNHKKLLKQFKLGNKATEAEIRELVSNGKINFKIFSAAMEEAFGEHAKDANKTFNGAMGNIGAALSRIGAKFIQPLIAQEGPFVRMFNSIRIIINEINKTIDPFANSFVNLMSSVADKISGIALITENNEKPLLKIRVLMYSITNIFETLKDVVGMFKKAFMDAFHLPTLDEINKSFFNLWVNTVNIRNYIQNNKSITKIINGLVAVLRILISVFKAVFSIIGHVIKKLAPLGDQLLEIFGYMGDATSKTEDFINANKVLERVVDHINKVLDPLIDFLISIYDILKKNFGENGTFGSKFFNSFFDILNKGIASLIISFGNLIGLDLTGFSEKVSSGLNSIKDGMSNIQSKLKEKWESKELEWLRNVLDNLKESVINIKNVFAETFDKVNEKLSAINISSSPVITILKTLFSVIMVIGKVAASVLSSIWELVGPLIKDMFGALSEGDVKKFTDIFNTLLSMLVGLKAYQGYSATIKFYIDSLKSFGKFLKDAPTYFKKIMSLPTTIQNIGTAFSSASKYLKTKEIESVAKSILMIAAAAYLIAKIPSKDLARSLVGIEAMLWSLIGVLKVLDGPGFDSKNMGKFSIVFISLSVSMLLLASALKKISKIDPDRLHNSLFALVALMASLVGAIKFMSSISGSLKKISTVLIAMGVSILLLSISLKTIAKIDPDKLTGSVIALLSLIAGLTIAVSIMKSVGGNLKKVSTVLIAIGVAMLLLTVSLKSLSKIDSDSLWNSFAVLSLMLLEVAAVISALAIVNKSMGNMKKVASALIMASIAILILSSALVKLTTEMNPDNAASALITLGVALAELAIALTFMEGTKGGAAALVVATVGLLLLAGVLKMLANSKPEDLLFAVLAMAAAMAIIVVTVVALSKIKGGISTLRKLGNGLIKIGFAFLLIGAGVALVGIGLVTINAALVAFAASTEIVIQSGMANITIFLEQLRLQIPIIAGIITDLFIAIVKSIGAQAGVLIETGKTLLLQILGAANEVLPQFFEFVGLLIDNLIALAEEKFPKISNAFVNMVLDLLDTIDKRGPELIEKATNTLIDLVNGLSNTLSEHKQELVDAFRSLAASALDAFILALGLEPQDENHKAAITKDDPIILMFIGKLLVSLGEKGADLIEALGEFGADCVEAVVNAFKGAYEAGKEFISKLWDGIKSGLSFLFGGVEDVAKDVTNIAKKQLGLISGSLTLGTNLNSSFQSNVESALNSIRLTDPVSNNFKNRISSVLSTSYSSALASATSNINTSPVITPVVDSSNVDAFNNSLNKNISVPVNLGKIIPTNSTYNKMFAAASQQNTSVSFVQNNYSPRSLSRIDIYRDTESLLNNSSVINNYVKQ